MRRRPGYLEFGVWTALGVLAVLGMLTALTIGVLVLPVAAVLTFGWLRFERSRDASMCGLGLGAGALLIYVAYLNRDGPGTVCRRIGVAGQSCTDEWNPWPWLIAGVLTGAGAVAIFERCRRLPPRR